MARIRNMTMRDQIYVLRERLNQLEQKVEKLLEKDKKQEQQP